MKYSEEWIEQFRDIILEFHKKKTEDPFKLWFYSCLEHGCFKDLFQRILLILINARFDQMTTAENALENTRKVVSLGALERLLSFGDVKYLIPRRNLSGEDWAKSFVTSLPKLHDLAKIIVEKRVWSAKELIDAIVGCHIPYFGIKTARLAVRWLHELVPELNIDMSDYDLPVDSLIYRVLCRLGILDPYVYPYQGKESIADKVVQRFARTVFPNYTHLLDEPLWIMGRRFCYPKYPNCWVCPLNIICKKRYRDVDPSAIGYYYFR